MKKTKNLFARCVTLLVLALLSANFAWGEAEVVSGRVYSTPKESNLPTGWSCSDGSGTSYLKLIASKHYLKTANFTTSKITGVTLKARTYGGPSEAQAKITISWIDESTSKVTALCTIQPKSTTLTNYSVLTQDIIEVSGTGCVKIECKEAGSSKGAGVSEVTLTFEENTTPSKTLESIAISGNPTKTTYKLGESFEPAGLTVTGTYSEGDPEIITSGIEWDINPSTFTLTSQTSATVTARVGTVNSDSFTVSGLTVTEAPKYELVTDVSTLSAGDKIIIASAVSDGKVKVMKAYESGNNCGQIADVSVSDNQINEVSGMAILTLGGSEGSWTLYDGTYYMNATGGTTSNYLKGQATADATNGTWTIAIDEKAIIKTVNTTQNVRNIIRYNSNSSCFSCYSSNQNDVYIYRLIAPMVSLTANITEIEQGNEVTLTASAKNFEGDVTYQLKSSTDNVNFTNVGEPQASATFNVSPSVTTYYKVVANDNNDNEATSAVCTIAVVVKYDVTASTPEGGTYSVKVGNAEAVEIESEQVTLKASEGTKVVLTSVADETHKLHSTPFIIKDADLGDVSVSKSGDTYSFVMPAKAVTITAQYTETYPIIISNEIVNGTVESDVERTSSNSKVTLTITPDRGYQYKENSLIVTVNESEDTRALTEVKAGETYTFSMVKPGVTVYAEFEELPKYAITWKSQGKTVASTIVIDGESLVLPEIEEPTATGYMFKGWTSATSVNADGADITYAKSGDAISANTTYYAVFAKDGFSNEYTQITALNQLEAGARYLIVGNLSSTYRALPVDKAEDLTTVTPSSSKITNPEEDLVWTLEGEAKKWKIKSVNNGEYIQISGGNLTFEESTAITFDASVSSNKFTFTSSASIGNKILSYYHNGAKFNAYSTANNVYLYKADSKSTDYSLNPTQVEVSISSANWASLGLPYAVTIPEKVSAYTAVVDDDNAVALTKINGTIPANCGVILYAEEGSYTFTKTDDVNAIENNQLVAVTEEVYICTGEDVNKVYYIGKDAGKAVFKKLNENGTIPVGKAYLKLKTPISNAKMEIVFGDEPTGIEEVQGSRIKVQSSAYNLNGVRVNENYKGIVIMNGKKYINK